MKKHIYIGTNKSGDDCCILKSLADFDTLKNNVDSIEVNDFVHDSTNWNGRDNTSRTCELMRLQLLDNPIELPSELVFEGYDYDWGNKYSWIFRVSKIYNTKDDI